MSNIHRPIVGASGGRYVLIMLVAFAITVVGTRLYLEATGYPQIGNDTFHFAHALWGGLLLVLSALLLLVFVNRWFYTLAATLAGVGAGLFVDEVGKFITQQNDYFFPLAAPVIYVTFLLLLLVYLLARNRPSQNLRADMYEILHELEEVLEDDFSVSERAAMLERLDRVQNQTNRPELAELARHISAFVNSTPITVIPDRETLFSRFITWYKRFEDRWLTQTFMRRIFVLIYVISAFSSAFMLVVLYRLLMGEGALREELLRDIFNAPNITGTTSASWYVVLIALHALCGVLILIGAGAFLLKREALAVWLGIVVMIITVAYINTVSFYFNQFSIVLNSAYAFIALLALQRYRTRFLYETQNARVSA